MNAVLLVNWYKPSGKWYAGTRIQVPDNFNPYSRESKDPLQTLIEKQQDELAPTWIEGEWFVSVSCIEQDSTDTRFFERLFKY